MVEKRANSEWISQPVDLLIGGCNVRSTVSQPFAAFAAFAAFPLALWFLYGRRTRFGVAIVFTCNKQLSFQ